MNHVSEYLPDYERLNAIRYGAAMELIDRGVTVPEFDFAVKRAQAVNVPSMSLGDVFKTALIFGVPLGTLAFVVGNSLKRSSRKIRKMRKTLDYFNTVSSELRNNAQGGM